MAQIEVTMITSVFGHNPDGTDYDLPAGEKVILDADRADEFIIKGYATGNLSKDYSDDEQAQIKSNIQYVVQEAVAADGGPS